VTALWTVIVLLSILVAVDSVAIIALTRQVGLLHLRAGPPPAVQGRRGPQAGGRLRLDVPPDIIDDGAAPDLILFGFVRPGCGGCDAALPAFASVASGLPGNERAVLVSDAEEAIARAYLTAHNVTVPLMAGPHLLRVNDIPATPYAVVTGRGGTVMATAPVISAEQLESVLGQARRSMAGPPRKEEGDVVRQHH
jgi:hypothetical protein